MDNTESLDQFIGNQPIVAYFNSLDSSRLTGPYLFVGPAQVGKSALVKLLAVKWWNLPASFVVQQPEWRELTDEGKTIKIDTVREWQRQLRQTGNRLIIGILPEAERLERGAANALLKLLEEPPQGVVIFLTSTNIHKLLPTIISRCSVFRFSKAKLTGDKEMVTLADGRPGRLLTWQKQPELWKMDKELWLFSEQLRQSFWLASQVIDDSTVKDNHHQLSTVLSILTLKAKERLIEILLTGRKRQPIYRWTEQIIEAHFAYQHHVSPKLLLENINFGYV